MLGLVAVRRLVVLVVWAHRHAPHPCRHRLVIACHCHLVVAPRCHVWAFICVVWVVGFVVWVVFGIGHLSRLPRRPVATWLWSSCRLVWLVVSSSHGGGEAVGGCGCHRVGAVDVPPSFHIIVIEEEGVDLAG